MKNKYFETLKDARAIDGHRVAVEFRNGRKGVFDCSPYLELGYYRKLNDPAFFSCAFVSCGDLAWPGDIDIGADDVWDEAKPIPVMVAPRMVRHARGRGLRPEPRKAVVDA